jgi:hypothetical protein
LRYHRVHWVSALGLQQHWRDARIDAEYVSGDALAVRTKNIQSLRLEPPRPIARLTIDGQEVTADKGPLEYEHRDGRWIALDAASAVTLRKRPGLQGPIDDAFLGPFLVVTPTGATNPDVQRWVDFELDHFRRRWKNLYRADLPEVRDVDVTDAHIRDGHLVAFGDPASNALIRRVARQLPLTWSADQLALGELRVSATGHVPLLIYPNPLHPEKYLVLNSGPTHREHHDRTNSLQNPKLGDWALVDVTVPPDAEHPGRVIGSGFFDESWQLPAASKVEKTGVFTPAPPRKLGAKIMARLAP